MSTSHNSLPTTAAAGEASVLQMTLLDVAVALHEGTSVAFVDAEGRAVSVDGSPYAPTREPTQAMRFVEKYVSRLARLENRWVAIGKNGRAEEGFSAMVAACKVAMNRAPEHA